LNTPTISPANPGHKMGFFRKSLIHILRFLRNSLLARPKLRGLLYDMDNREEFTDLFEQEKMLADRPRTETYRNAIRKYLGPDDVVLDLGTGNGILSFFAARQNAKKIYAIDHSDFIEMTIKVSEHNNFHNIEFVKCHSRDFQPGEKIDILIHEQIGDYLFNENLLENLLDLKARILKSNGRIIPGKFELFLEPTRLVESARIPYIFNNKMYGIDYSVLKDYYDTLEEFKPATYEQRWLDNETVEYFLGEISPILSFDLNEIKSEEEIPRVLSTSKEVIRSGPFDGFCLFFNVIFDEEISFSTSPLENYTTHWGNCFFRVKRRNVSEGDEIAYKFLMENLLDIKTWSVSIEKVRQKSGTQA
jgi:protein arginine N-methyltransferase 1